MTVSFTALTRTPSRLIPCHNSKRHLSMSDPTSQDPLKDLQNRIDAVKNANDDEAGSVAKGYSGAEMAWRMVIELVVAIAIGFGMGYGLDIVFGTMPVFLVIFTLLGFVAGIKTVIRSGQELQAKQMAAQASDEKRN